jgi:hypothetical protein
MAFVKRKSEEKPDLLAELLAFRTKLDRYISDEVMKLKGSPTGASLPIESLRMMLTRNDSCLCRAAARILGNGDA